MFNGITKETPVDDETRFVCFSMTSFGTRFISCTTTNLGQNGIVFDLILSLLSSNSFCSPL
jgi:hypothetical protein